MFRKIIPLFGAALMFAAAPAFVADYCITVGPPSPSVYVGKNFMPLPAPGQCKAWQGFCQNCSPDNVQTGIACTASNGSHVSFGITTYYLASNRMFDWVRLDLPGQTGSGNMNYQNPALGTQNYATEKGAPCVSPPVP